MKRLAPSQQYSVENEALFRTEVQQADVHNLKDNVGFYSFTMLDSVDQQAYRITLVSGVLTATVIP